AQCVTSFSKANSSTPVKAKYSVDGSSDTTTVSVQAQYTTTTALYASTNHPVVGQPVTFTATVTSSGPGIIPTGQVTVSDNSPPPPPATGSFSLTLSSGTGSCNYAFSTVGNHVVKAVYGGDIANSGSTYTGTVEVEVVGAGSTTTSLSSNA